MKKLSKMFTSLLLALVVCTTSVYAAPSKTELQNKKNQANSELSSLKNELSAIMTEMNAIEQQLIAKGEAIISAKSQLEDVKENEKLQYESMMKRIATMYENNAANSLTMILESGSVAEALQKIQTARSLYEYDRKALNEFVKTRESIESLKATLESEQAGLQSLQTELSAKQSALNNKIAAKKTEISNIDDEIRAASKVAANNSYGGGRPYKGTGNPAVGQAIVARARSYIGVWYLWGGNDRNGIDCSGLTKAVHAEVGITIDRWSGHQEIGGKGIPSLAEAMPGDIICYPGHVAIYIGNYRVIHAPRTGKQVQEATVYLKEITAIRRYW